MSTYSDLKQVFNDSEFKTLDKIARKYNERGNNYAYPIAGPDYNDGHTSLPNWSKYQGGYSRSPQKFKYFSTQGEMTDNDSIGTKHSFDKNISRQLTTNVSRDRIDDYNVYDNSYMCNDVDTISYDSVDNLMEHIKQCKKCRKNFKNQFKNKHTEEKNIEHFVVNDDDRIIQQLQSQPPRPTYNYDISPYINDLKEILLVLLVGIIVIIILAAVYNCSA